MNINTPTLPEERKLFILYILIFIAFWIFTVYIIFSPLLSWFKFKKKILQQTTVYEPSEKTESLRKNFFNLKVFSNSKTVDITDDNLLKATFYRSERNVKFHGKSKPTIDYSDIKAIVARYKQQNDWFLLNEKRHIKISTAKIYIISTTGKYTLLCTMHCRFDALRAEYEKNTLHKDEDFKRIFENYSKEFADMVNFPLMFSHH